METGGGYDVLTGLPGEMLLAEWVDEMCRTAAPDVLIGLCCLELDPVSQPSLVDVAHRLDKGLAAPGNLVARLGTHEFAVLVAGSGSLPGAAAHVAAQAFHLLATPFHAGARETSVAVGIGVVERLAAETTYEELLAAARLVMRRARSGNRYDWIAVDLDRACAMVRMR